MRIIGSLAGYIFVCLLMLASATASGANEPLKSIGEPDWDWRPGDLIFRNGMNGFDDRLREAGGWKWASVGILRSASAGVRVVYVDENEGVLEQTFEDYVSGLSTDEYVVYRAEALVASDPEGQMLQGPLAKYGLFVAYGASFDPQFTFGNGSFYNAELPFEAALNAGVVLGKTITIGELARENSDLRELFLSKMDDHPYCVVAMGRDECWHEIEDISVVTAEAILSSPHLRRVFPR